MFKLYPPYQHFVVYTYIIHNYMLFVNSFFIFLFHFTTICCII
nr:MAG TPA: hypothetical protein [Caudoviricetes sp.]